MIKVPQNQSVNVPATVIRNESGFAFTPEKSPSCLPENLQGGVGVSAPASTSGVAIYSQELPEKKSVAFGEEKNMGGAGRGKKC